MFGKTGNAKTHLAIACLIKFLHKSHGGYYQKFYKLIDIKLEDKERFCEIINSKLLIIDELCEITEYKSQLLFEIVDERYDNQLPTIFITNRSIEDIRNFMTDATLSRIKECYTHLNFNGNDKRYEDGE